MSNGWHFAQYAVYFFGMTQTQWIQFMRQRKDKMKVKIKKALFFVPNFSI
jgi:hypothetical protein